MMIVDREFIPFILMQRTHYMHRSFFYKALSKALRITGYTEYPSIVKANQLFNPGKIRDLYQADMEAEFSSISGHIPYASSDILDIGSGIGGIDVLLAAHYRYAANIFLIDKSVVDRNFHYGFEPNGSFYNSLTLSKKFLTTNGVPTNRIFLQEATPNYSIDFNTQFDLILSFISWGFHYPVETYLNSVYEKLRTDGVCLLDIRNGTTGLRVLEKKFKSVKVIKDFGKYSRVLAIK